MHLARQDIAHCICLTYNVGPVPHRSGFAADTVAVQVFATMSWVSVLLHTFAYDTWLKWRESMCVYTNIIYALVTILKIFHLLPRLPNGGCPYNRSLQGGL